MMAQGQDATSHTQTTKEFGNHDAVRGFIACIWMALWCSGVGARMRCARACMRCFACLRRACLTGQVGTRLVGKANARQADLKATGKVCSVM